ncbi:MAG TPA: L,D-transpeptidase family protein [Lachnospiraceae bacterium]
MKKKSKALKITIGIFIGFILIVAGAYAGAAYYFKSHFYSGSKVNGVNVSEKTVEEAEKLVNDKLKEYSLTIEGRNQKILTITGNQIDLNYVADDTIQKLMDQQDSWKWIFTMSARKDYTMTANTQYDEKKLKKLLEESSFLKADQVTAPADAYIEETENGYVVAAEVMGDTILEDTLIDLVKTSIDKGQNKITIPEESYLAPKVLSTDEAMNAKVESWNRYLSNVITIPFGEGRQEVLDRGIIGGMLEETAEGGIAINREQVLAYVNSLGKKYDTFGLAHEFTKHDGSKMTIPGGGDYGWAMNKSATTDELMALMENGGEQTFEPVYRYSAKSRNVNDIGGTYAEISLAEQMMWVFKDGNLVVETPIVSGLPIPSRITHTGLFAIDGKKSPDVLDGEGYSQPVTYWLPFNGNEGIHDAPWRSEFGGGIYQGGGSHGCINTPPTAMKTVFSTLAIGDPVIVY